MLIPVTVLLAMLGGGLGACSGQQASGWPEPPPAGRAPPGVEVPPVLEGTLHVVVHGPGEEVLPNARVTVWPAGQRHHHEALTDARGMVTFEKVGGQVDISVSHAIGWGFRNPVTVPVDGQRTQVVTIEPGRFAVALLPPRIVEADLNADRTELRLHTQVIAARPPGFVMDGFTHPHLRLNECWVRIPTGSTTPICDYSSARGIAVMSYSHETEGAAVSGMDGAGATMLLIDQSLGTSRYDPHDIRWMAARRFLQVVGEAPAASSHPIVVAGFNDVGLPGSWSPLLLPSPAWDMVDPAGAFHVPQPVRDATLEELRGLGGGTAATLAVFTRAFELMQQHAPPGQRVLVALISAPDEHLSQAVSDAAQLAALAQAQSEAGVRSILITARLAESSPARATLADLAAALDTPLIVAGYPDEWYEGHSKDHLYGALQFAGQIAAGAGLPAIKATFRVQAEPGTRFEAGTMFRGTLFVSSDICPMGCGELPLVFSARIP